MGEGDGIEMSVGVSLTRSLVRVAVGGEAGSGASGTSQAHLSRCHLPGVTGEQDGTEQEREKERERLRERVREGGWG